MADWTSDLQALVACKVLPKLPNLNDLRSATATALQQTDSGQPAGPASSSQSTAGDTPLFASQQLYDAVLSCVNAEPGIPARARNPAALLIASVAMEEYVRSHSTKARLLSEQYARRARVAAMEAAAAADAAAAAEAAAAAARSNDDEDDGDAELLAFLRQARPDQIADRLLGVLGEPEQTRVPLANIVRQHDPDTLVAILRQTRLAHASGDNLRADGGGKRTLGGIFFREAKRFKAGARREEAQAALPELPPLRPYQRDTVGMVLASWGVRPLPAELMRGGDGSAAEQAERYVRMACGWSRNWLVSAPTNSGKTRMFVEVTRGVIASKPAGRGAIVVVLVPNVILTTQHATYFERANLPRTSAAAHSSDNQLSVAAWQAALAAAGAPGGGRAGGGSSSVLVCTAASFVNLLQLEVAKLEQLDLLVLDEAHHCKEDHPYAQVLRHYDASAPSAPRLLAVTASPASEKDMTTLVLRMTDLLTRLDARLHVLGEEDPHLAAALPEPRQLECGVAMRGVDLQLMRALQSYGLHAALELAESLADVDARGRGAQEDKARLEQDLDAAISACQAPGAAAQRYPVTALDPLGQWLARGLEFASKYGCPHLELVCRFVDVLRKSTELVEDAGFEGSLPFLARKAAALCREEAEAERRKAAGAGGSGAAAAMGAPSGPAASMFRGLMFSAAVEAAAAGAASRAGPAGGTAGASSSSSAAAASSAAAKEPGLFAALRSATADLPSAHAVAAERAASTGAAPGNSCSDVPLRVSRLIRELLVEGREVQFLAAPGSASLLRGCFVSGALQEERTFPKFWALLHYLQRYRGRATFHGIIFVKTRQAVFHVTDMMRRAEQLQFMEVFELIGHNSAAGKRSTLAPERDRHGRGMSDTQQQQVLRLFKEPGRKVLVATSAAEEGLDVPSCEFVVRYNAAATGIQLLQSRGRARRKVAEFFAILQDGTLDTELHAKSRLEEANMRAYGRMHAEVAMGRGGSD